MMNMTLHDDGEQHIHVDQGIHGKKFKSSASSKPASSSLLRAGIRTPVLPLMGGRIIRLVSGGVSKRAFSTACVKNSLRVIPFWAVNVFASRIRRSGNSIVVRIHICAHICGRSSNQLAGRDDPAVVVRDSRRMAARANRETESPWGRERFSLRREK